MAGAGLQLIREQDPVMTGGWTTLTENGRQ
jgi:hypothetical protein